MNREEFIEGIFNLRNSCVTSIIKKLTRPAGRSPHPHVVELSKFYNGLDVEQKTFIEKLAREVADQVLFSFMCILDRTSFIEDTEEKTVFELYATKNGEKVLLNPFVGEELHDLYNSLAQAGS